MLALNAKLRAQVVAPGKEGEGVARPVSEPEPDGPHDLPRWASRISGARLLERVFEIDMEHCPNCGGELKVIAAIRRA